MGRQRRRVTCCLLLAAALTMSLAGVAPAHKLSSGSFLELSSVATGPTTIQYSGRVNSASRFCSAGRTVRIFVGGNLLAIVRTGAAGGWSLSGARPPVGTEVTATIGRTVRKSRNHRHICSGDSLTKKTT